VTADLYVDLNPVWDQIIYTPVHSLKETLLLEVMDYQNLTKDRSLGTVELRVNVLAQEITEHAGDPQFSFESTGKIDKSEPIRLDRGNQYKGQLHYVAEFLPAFALRGLEFETGPNELQTAVEEDEDEDGGVVSRSSSSSQSEEDEDEAITTSEPISVSKGEATGSTNTTEAGKTVSAREGTPPSGKTRSSVDEKNDAKGKNEGVQMSKDELLAHRRWYLHSGPLFTNINRRIRNHHFPRQIWRATCQEGPLGGSPRWWLLACLQHYSRPWSPDDVATCW